MTDHHHLRMTSISQRPTTQMGQGRLRRRQHELGEADELIAERHMSDEPVTQYQVEYKDD